MELFFNIFLAHLIGDFYLQTDNICRNKEQKGFSSPYLYVHVILITVLTYTLSNAYQSFWLYALIIGLSHLIIDGIKSYFHKYALHTFCIDQILHIVILGATAYCYLNLNPSWSQFSCLSVLEFQTIPAIICAAVICCKPANILIRLVLEGYKIDMPKAGGKDLNNAGSLIGNLERLICLALVLAGQFEAVGFLIAAKSILRFKDYETAKTEYVLVGTLLSFGIAILSGLLLTYYIL